MTTKTFKVPNISCGHCVHAIQNEVSELEGVKTVKGSPENKSITIEWKKPATLEAIRSLLEEINYPAE